MADITIEQLAEFMGKQIPATFTVFDQHRQEDSTYNGASWARGRIDAYFQILEIIDKDGLDVLRAQWEDVVDGKSGEGSDEE
jgi:hypothetical protein